MRRFRLLSDPSGVYAVGPPQSRAGAPSWGLRGGTQPELIEGEPRLKKTARTRFELLELSVQNLWKPHCENN